jgi:hypothetical protein
MPTLTLMMKSLHLLSLCGLVASLNDLGRSLVCMPSVRSDIGVTLDAVAYMEQ